MVQQVEQKKVIGGRMSDGCSMPAGTVTPEGFPQVAHGCSII
jgi:hypothetical protein